MCGAEWDTPQLVRTEMVVTVVVVVIVLGCCCGLMGYCYILSVLFVTYHDDDDIGWGPLLRDPPPFPIKYQMLFLSSLATLAIEWVEICFKETKSTLEDK